MTKIAAKWILKDSNSLQDSSGNLQVFTDESSVERSASGLRVKALGVTDGMLAGSISFTKLADYENIARLDQAETVVGEWTFSTALPKSSIAPTSAEHFVNKAYADSISAGLDPKQSVRVATTVDLDSVGNGTWIPSGSGVNKTLTAGADGVTTIDTKALVLNDRVLVKNSVGADDVHNGVYVVTTEGTVSATTVLTRATDFDGSPANEVSGGNFVFVEQGSVNVGSGWTVVADGDVTVDTDDVVWSQFSGGGQIIDGDGIDKSGNTISVNVGDIVGTGLENDGSNNLRIASTAAGDGLNGGSGSALSVDVSDLAGTGLENDGSNNLRIAAAAAGDGLNGGAGSALSVDVDDIVGTGLENDGSNNLRIAAAAAGNGLTGGAGVALAVGAGNGITVSADAIAVNPAALISGGAAEVDGDKLDIDYVATNYTPAIASGYSDATGQLASHLKGIDNALVGISTEEQKTEIHLITSGETTAGYFTLSSAPTNAQSVRVFAIGGPAQVNKNSTNIGSVTPDFQILSSNQLHFNNNGSATGLSGDLTTGDVITVVYSI